MAELREISPEKLKVILAEHEKWLDSDKKEGKCANLSGTDLNGVFLSGANLSGADLSGANLFNANLSGTDLSGADLSRANLFNANLNGADLKEADFRSANLSGAFLYNADLSGAFLYRADLSGTNLSGANLSQTELRWADLSWIDLSASKLYKARIRDQDLSGVKYHPEQLKDLIIEQSEEDLLIVPEQRGRLIIQLDGEKPPVLHLIYLLDFLEYQYDILYILLFSQYESFEKLRDILSGSPYHWLKDKDEAIKIERIKTGPLKIAINGLSPIWVMIFALAGYFHGRTDLLQNIVIILFKLKKEELKEKLQVEIKRIRAEIFEKNKNLFETSRKPDEVQADHSPPAQQGEPTPDLFDISDQTDSPPRKDLLETVLFLRQEGLLTNKLSDQEVANLLEIYMENFGREFQSIRDHVGDFKMGIAKEEVKDKK